MPLASNQVAPYASLAISTLPLQRFDETRQIIHEAQARKLDDYHTPECPLCSRLSRGGPRQRWRNSNSGLQVEPDYENDGLALTSDTAAYGGHLGKARELTKRAVDSAIRADNKEAGAIWQENAAHGTSGLRQSCGSPAVSE